MKSKDLKQADDLLYAINKGVKSIERTYKFMRWYKSYVEVFAIILGAIIATAWAITPILYIYYDNFFWLKLFVGAQAVVLIIWSQSIWVKPLNKYIVNKRTQPKREKGFTTDDFKFNQTQKEPVKTYFVRYPNGLDLVVTNEPPVVGGYMADSNGIYKTPDIDGFIGFYKAIATNGTNYLDKLVMIDYSDIIKVLNTHKKRSKATVINQVEIEISSANGIVKITKIL